MKRQKKEISPERKVRRLKIIVIAITIAILFILIPTGKKTEDIQEYPYAEIESHMDMVLDSLLCDRFPEGCEVIRKSEVFEALQHFAGDKKSETEALARQEQILLSADIDNMKREVISSAFIQERKKIENKYKSVETSPFASITYHTRKIIFKTPDGTQYTCLQQKLYEYDVIKYVTKYEKYSKTLNDENPNLL